MVKKTTICETVKKSLNKEGRVINSHLWKTDTERIGGMPFNKQ